MDAFAGDPNHGFEGFKRPPRQRRQKLTAWLPGKRKIITENVDATMAAYLAAIGEVLRRGIAAQKQGIELPTFLSILRDTAMR